MKQSSIFSLWIAIAALALHTKTNAAEFAVPDWSDNPNARFSQWLNFTSARGEPGNSPDVEGSNAGGLLTQSVPGALVTGSGNIYNPAAPSVFFLIHESDSPYQTVVLQTKIIGDIDTENVALEYEKDGQTESIMTPAVELARESGGFGDTIIYQWTWNLSGLGLTQISLRFGAAGAHASLVSVRLDILLETTVTGETIEASFDKPSQDRWNYPRNSTPGVRALASLFQTADPEVGVYQYGTFIVGFDTSNLIPEGNASGAYQITSAQLRLMTSGNFEVPYDPDYDPVVSHLPETHELYLADEDPGRPIYVFGTGFRNDFNIETWNETTPYSPGGDAQRTVFPMIINESGLPQDVSLAVDYNNPSDTAPFAVGRLEDTKAGDLIPEDTWMIFDIDLNNSGTLAYLQQGLSQGKLSFTFTSLNQGGREVRAYPEFYTSDHLVGEATQLQLSVRIVDGPTLPVPPVITSIRRTADGITIQFTSTESGTVGIRWTTDFTSWAEVDTLAIEPLGNGQYEWTDSQANAAMKFYRVFITP